MRFRTLPTLVVAATVAASVGSAVPAYAAPPAGSSATHSGHVGGNQHSIDAHLRNELRKAAKAAGVVVDTGTPSTSGVGAPEGSYSLTSSTYSMGKFGDSPAVLATCGTGYYVDYYPLQNSIQLNITVNSSSNLVASAFGYPNGWDQVGSVLGVTDPALYQGFFMKLSNDNPVSSNTGSFSWTCDPLS